MSPILQLPWHRVCETDRRGGGSEPTELTIRRMVWMRRSTGCTPDAGWWLRSPATPSPAPFSRRSYPEGMVILIPVIHVNTAVAPGKSGPHPRLGKWRVQG